MNTQMDEARAGRITPVMKAVAADEKQAPEKIRAEIARGRAVLPANPRHKNLRPKIAGRAFRTKVNANIGLSTEQSDSPRELRKLVTALEAGADFVMDLSVGPDLSGLRRRMLANCPVPFGTVPIYEAVCRTGGAVESFDPEVLMEVIAEQAGQGVDFMTLHAGLLKEYVPLAMKRRAGIVSRGGAILAAWMKRHKAQNPLYARWPEVLEICKAHDVTVSLGDGLRPGCLADASDKAQFAELDTIGALVRQCRRRGVQVMVEGPGHVPFDQIRMNVEREQKVCGDAPFYVLGPVVTDVAPGYDHISACIGACAAASYGASLLCYVTPAEHLGLPNKEEVREGLIAFRIAAHAADVARGLRHARDWDDAMTGARFAFDWDKQFQLALDGKKARARFRKITGRTTASLDHCSMCGAEFCAMRISQKIRCGKRR
ncbi:MAG: phosphomethylpyrimidine synthase ThiC [Kiritimatiellae bacterium]|jgi:phosphomethylpyrimidine synthase|nr:phosphomethylpyrimidine synthase ThiC [Kiritimatiellia bacterium]